MTREHFREFVSRLASQIGVEVARDQIESPLQFVIGEQRVIPDQDVSTQSPEFIIYAEIGPIDARRELEVMRIPLEGNHLCSQTVEGRGVDNGTFQSGAYVFHGTRDGSFAEFMESGMSGRGHSHCKAFGDEKPKGLGLEAERAAEQSTRARQPTANDDRVRPYR
jgi:hypothetical protein